MHGVNFDSCNDIETCLLEPETHSPGARKEIDADRTTIT